MSIDNKSNKDVKIEGEIIKAEEGAIEKALPVESIKIVNEGDKKGKLKTESKEYRNKEIEKLKSDIEIINSKNEGNEGGNNESKKDNKNEGDKNENKFRSFEIDSDTAVPVEISDSMDEDFDVVKVIMIDSNGRTYGDNRLDYEQLGFKLEEARSALDRLQKKKEKLPPTNKLLETIRKAFSNEYTINSEINKKMVAQATQGIGRLEKRIQYLEGRISKELG
ncbi:MAG: hypothetical protein WCW54_00655 [Candidatus Paceibacterota bacterium]